MVTTKRNEEFVITKKIAKQGSQAMIVIPKILENKLKPGIVVKITIEVLEEVNLNDK